LFNVVVLWALRVLIPLLAGILSNLTEIGGSHRGGFVRAILSLPLHCQDE
jgi:hypothetical protein